jgi:hypothetical protein
VRPPIIFRRQSFLDTPSLSLVHSGWVPSLPKKKYQDHTHHHSEVYVTGGQQEIF